MDISLPQLSASEELAYELVVAMRVGPTVRAMIPPAPSEADRLALSGDDQMVETARSFSRDLISDVLPKIEATCAQVLVNRIPEDDLRELAVLYRRPGFADRFQLASTEIGQAMQAAVEAALRSRLGDL